MVMEENAINRAAIIDDRIFEAYDDWEEYAKERCLENPWATEDKIMAQYRHFEETEFGWKSWTDEISEEDSLRLSLNEEYKKRYIKMRDLFVFYQLKEWMEWDRIQPYIPKWCKELFYPCDVAGNQCSLECQWWPCQNEKRKTPEMEVVMKFVG